MSNADPVFIKEYHVVNRADPKKYPDPVSMNDIKLLKQMGADVKVDNVLKTVYILNGKRTWHRREETRRIFR